MKKGFTLIELLAVIVILAIIALIATPIVLNIIEESKENANLRSAEFYLDAVELAVANKNLEEAFSPSICNVLTDGNLQCGSTLLEIDVNGEVPTSGTIIFEDGKIKNYQNLFIGEKYITKGESGAVASNTASTNKILSSLCVPADASTVTTGNVPAGSYTNGDEYICEVKDGVIYNFFVISKNLNDDGSIASINLIVDRNIGEGGMPASTDNLSLTAWCSKKDYDAKNAEEAAAGTSDGVDTYSYENNYAPNNYNVMVEEGALTALKALKKYVSTWDNIVGYPYNMSIDPYAVSNEDPGVVYIPDPEAQSNALQKAIWTPYSLNETLKARLMTVTEALGHGCKYEINTTENGEKKYGNVYPESCPLYLANYLQHKNGFITGDKVVDVDGLRTYWLLNGNSSVGYLIHDNGSLNSKYTTVDNYAGIRPVITLNETDLG